MRAMRVVPGLPDSAATVELAEPEPTAERPYVLESVLVGLCGTDRELLRRHPPASRVMTIGHESLARVVSAPGTGEHQPGDFVVGVIRQACSQRCRGCLIGRFDLCLTRPITERGIYGRDGFGSDRWTASEDALVQVPTDLGERGILVEPLTCLVKGRRRLLDAHRNVASSSVDRLLVSGAGPIGLLASWYFGQVFESVVLVDPFADAEAVAAAALLPSVEFVDTWADVERSRFDAFVECSGSIDAIISGLPLVLPAGTVVLEGICGSNGRALPSAIIQSAVLNDLTILATVNASHRDHLDAVEQLASAPVAFLDALTSREITPEDWPTWAIDDRPTGVKTVVRFQL